MDEEKILKEIGEVSKALSGFKTDLGEKVSKSDLNAVTSAVEEVKKNVGKIEAEKLGESMGAIKKQIEEMTEKVNQLRDKQSNPSAVKTIDQLVHEKADAFKAIANGGGKDAGFKFRVKADQNVDKTVVYSSSVTSSSLSYREPAIGQLAAPNTVFDKVFRTVNLSEADLAASNGVISYLDVTAETNNAAETAETNSQTVGSNNKPESAITWQEYTQALRVIADTIPVTRNAYRHLGFIASEIDRLLRKNQALRKDLQIYKGDGNAPNIKGIYTFTTAVTLASMPRYQNVVQPNLADLAADLSVYVANKSDASGAQMKYMPNVLFINPADALRFFEKGSDGHYVLPPYFKDGKAGNLTIIESPRVTVNTLMVGDASYGTIYQAEDVIIEAALVNDQFLKNQWTLRAEQELCFLQRTADLGAFTKVTDITAALVALAKP
jgi:hypothetical protein